MCCFGCKSEEGHVHNATLNEVPKYFSDPSSLNLGIYLDEDTITVGTITPRDAKEPEIILEIPAEVTFFNEKIMIGGNSEKNRMHENHFRVYDLIKETTSPSPVISLTSGQYPLQEEEILAIFLEQLFSKVKSTKSVPTIGSVVITLPFNVTSFEKERIEIACKAVGLLDVRILSSLLTTAVAFARTRKYYRKKRARIQSIFVSQYLRQTFNMALVDIGPDFIATRKCVSSINLNGGQDKPFEEYHTQMFENKTILSEKTRYVYSVYKRGVRRLESCCKRIRYIDPIVIKATPSQSTLDNNFMEIFRKEVQFTVKTSGPLAGACLLASRFLPTTEIPRKLIVCDASLTNLIVASTIGRKKRGKIQNKNYCPGVIFKPKIKISTVKENTVTLKEEYFKHRVKSTICQYNIVVEKGNFAKTEVKIKLRCQVDRDGIFRVSPIFPPGMNGSIVKVNAPSVDSDSYSEYNKLRSYYKALQNDAYTPTYPRFFRLTSIPEGSKEDLLDSSETEILASTELPKVISEDEDPESDFQLKSSALDIALLTTGQDVNFQENFDKSLWHNNNIVSIREESFEDDEKKIKAYMLEEIWSYDFAMQKLQGKTPDEIEAAHQGLKAEAEEEFKQKVANAGLQINSEWIRQLGEQLQKISSDEPDDGVGVFLLDDLNYELENSDRTELDAKSDVQTEDTPEKINMDSEVMQSLDPTFKGTFEVDHKDTETILEQSIKINQDKKPQEINPELLQVIEEVLNKFMDVGFTHHRTIMHGITDKKEPFTDAQITNLHRDNLEAVKSAFDQTLNDITATYPLLEELATSASNELERKTNFQLLTYLKRYETMIGALVRKVKECTLMAEAQYDDEMENFDHTNKTANEVHTRHNEFRDMALKNFENMLRETEAGWSETWRLEIEANLNERLEDLLKECFHVSPALDQGVSNSEEES